MVKLYQIILFLTIDTVPTLYIHQMLPTLWITHDKGMMLPMNGTVFYILIVLTLYSYLNGNISTINKVNPSFYTMLTTTPSNIIIEFRDVLVHRKAFINGLRFNCIALYGVVSFSSTLLPCLEELIGA